MGSLKHRVGHRERERGGEGERDRETETDRETERQRGRERERSCPAIKFPRDVLCVQKEQHEPGRVLPDA